MAEHTPTPWRVIAGDDYYIAADAYPKEFIGKFKGDDTGDYVAWVGNRPEDFGEANAAFIVKAANNHEALVAMLEEARLQIEYMQSKFEPTGTGNAVLARIRATLSDVGGT